MPVPTRKGISLVDFDDIRFAVIEGETVVLHTLKGTLFTDFRITELEARLPSERFLRVHRKALVNVARVDRLEDQDTGGYLAILDDGSRVAVSRQVARRLRRAWEIPR